MVKTTHEPVDLIIKRYVDRLQQEIDLSRVFLAYTVHGAPDGELTDIWLLIVSPTFAGMEWTDRIELVALAGIEVSHLIQSWPCTPEELAGHREGEGYNPFLAMMLSGSTEVYTAPDVGAYEQSVTREGTR